MKNLWIIDTQITSYGNELIITATYIMNELLNLVCRKIFKCGNNEKKCDAHKY